MKIEIEQQVLDFVGSPAPEPPRLLRESLRKLELRKGNIRPLEGELESFYRLPVGRYRIIFCYRRGRRSREVRCIYAAHRTIIYEVFAREFHKLLEG